ncbi:Predicted amidophosphoribosyltransferases [Geodermatophilus dictyosporus]|uniref:Predicted amidophosphoribosyltransferases n=1 Tax=Geodermatophilus dictyosporus TaxID=1523247 RepID=A0A1I5L801_9ACTN|nr:ComF family protein [Geodermatophilus dictyosporus]SFO93469.1 Predicted amidophosphoribosyltransferases [Geodermatophilus dictyosporus]
MGGLGAALADLVLPRTCAGCGVPGPELCRRCARLLARPHVATPRRVPAGLPPVVAAGAYAGPVRAAVIAFKERGRAALAGPLGTALALAVAAGAAVLPGRPVLLVPVPPSRASLRSRGRDHVRELAGVAVAELSAAGVAAGVVPLLARAGRVRDSAGLSVADRRANLAGTFVPRRRPAVPPGAVLVLVDDVLTSGATLTEAAATLAMTRRGGDTPVLAAVVAATPRAPVPGVRHPVADGAPRGVLRDPLDRLSTPPDSD